MKGILKKTLPILAAIVLIIVIAVTASAIKKNNAKTPNISSNDELY